MAELKGRVHLQFGGHLSFIYHKDSADLCSVEEKFVYTW